MEQPFEPDETVGSPVARQSESTDETTDLGQEDEGEYILEREPDGRYRIVDRTSKGSSRVLGEESETWQDEGVDDGREPERGE